MRKWLVILFVITSIVFWKGYSWWMQRPSWIQFGSVGSQSFSVAWISRGPSVGCMTVLSVPAPTYIRTICSGSGLLPAHLTKLDRLRPQQRYVVYWSTNGIIDPTSVRLVSTRSEMEQPTLPKALMGSVFDYDDAPVEGTLVMVWPTNQAAEYPELAITNKQGNWLVDIGMYQQTDNKWMVESGSTLWNWNWQEVEAPQGLVPNLEVER